MNIRFELFKSVSQKFIILFLVTLPISQKSLAQGFNGKVSVNALYQIYKKGSLFTAESASLYKGQIGEIITHYFTPKDFYKKINSKGEITIYTPEDNTVTFMQNSQYSSSTELLYFFVNNLTQDMGLKNEGFTQTGTRREDNYLITTWQSPPGMRLVSSVELVSENFLPIFAQYIDSKGKVLKKIYYYNYYNGPRFFLPQKITEITYVAEGDSTVRRTTFSDIKTGFNADENLFDFKIPEDATKVDF
jgi:outer membrane lipoprotein-sorting protein